LLLINLRQLQRVAIGSICGTDNANHSAFSVEISSKYFESLVKSPLPR
jgi:hypothetical protein